MPEEKLEKLRSEILRLISDYHAEKSKSKKFTPGESPVPYSGAVFDDKEMGAMASAVLNGWFGLGPYAEQFTKMLTGYIGCKETVLANSGSSASLLAISSLMSPMFPERLKPGDKVITPACTFPTTINPILQNGLDPVLVDVELGTYNIDASRLKEALSEKVRAIVIPHTLGNPNEMNAVMDFAKDHGLIVVEDCCDALGSEYNGKKVGSFGALGTLSMYPAHHITTGEGGAVFVNDTRLSRPLYSLRDWGRACWCKSTEKNPSGACGKRFDFKLNGVPYDHRYVFSHIGYNLKPIEMQAAMGVEQMKKFPEFVKARERNFRILFEEFSNHEEWFILPRALPKAKPCWFAFPLTIRKDAPFTRDELVRWLESRRISTRLVFAGNVLHQPAYAGIKFKQSGTLENTEFVMQNTFFLGIYPGLSEEMMGYICSNVREFAGKHRKG